MDNPYIKAQCQNMISVLDAFSTACELAAYLNVPNLILYHTEDDNIERRKALYTAEGRLYYKGNLYVPDDLECIELDKEE